MSSQFSVPRGLFCVLLWAVSMCTMAQESPTVVIVGDSLSAAYGMSLSESWPKLLEQRLADNDMDYRVINASITGDTTQGGRSRLPRLLKKYAPSWVIIELGGNDGLRGLSLDVTRDNLLFMITESQAAGASVVLTGILLPPNYGATYTEKFQSLYGELSRDQDALLVPFFMEGVALVDGMMQADGIHPNAAAQPILLDNVWRVLQPELLAR